MSRPARFKLGGFLLVSVILLCLTRGDHGLQPQSAREGQIDVNEHRHIENDFPENDVAHEQLTTCREDVSVETVPESINDDEIYSHEAADTLFDDENRFSDFSDCSTRADVLKQFGDLNSHDSLPHKSLARPIYDVKACPFLQLLATFWY